MTVEMKDIEVGSVVIDIRGCVGIVTEITNRPAYPVTFAVKSSGTRYKARPDLFKAVIGKVDINAFLAACSKPVDQPQHGGTDISCLMPEPLRSMGLKIGDKIKVRNGFETTEAIFDGYNTSRPKYPVSYIIDGKRWKGAVSAIIGKAA